MRQKRDEKNKNIQSFISKKEIFKCISTLWWDHVTPNLNPSSVSSILNVSFMLRRIQKPLNMDKIHLIKVHWESRAQNIVFISVYHEQSFHFKAQPVPLSSRTYHKSVHVLTEKLAVLFCQTSQKPFQMISRCSTRGRALDQGLFHRPVSFVSVSSFSLNRRRRLMEKVRGQRDLELPLLFDIFVVFWPNPSACGRRRNANKVTAAGVTGNHSPFLFSLQSVDCHHYISPGHFALKTKFVEILNADNISLKGQDVSSKWKVRQMTDLLT